MNKDFIKQQCINMRDKYWYCDNCNKMQHWYQLANVDTNGNKYCDECIENMNKRKE